MRNFILFCIVFGVLLLLNCSNSVAVDDPDGSGDTSAIAFSSSSIGSDSSTYSTDTGTGIHAWPNNLGIDSLEFIQRLESSVVGEMPDGAGNPHNLCGDGKMQLMEGDPYCGYVDIGQHCVELINFYRAKEGLQPFVRAPEYESCAAREARLAVESGKAHFSDGCGWRAQASTGGGRGGDDSPGTVEKSVNWAPKLIYQEGPEGGHYQGMMTEEARGVACGYYALNRDSHRIIINYYNNLN